MFVLNNHYSFVKGIDMKSVRQVVRSPKVQTYIENIVFYLKIIIEDLTVREVIDLNYQSGSPYVR